MAWDWGVGCVWVSGCVAWDAKGGVCMCVWCGLGCQGVCVCVCVEGQTEHPTRAGVASPT